MPDKVRKRIEVERDGILHKIEDWLETPLVALAFVWLILMALEFTSNEPTRYQGVANVIWVIFILEFILKFVIAPRKLVFLKNNVLGVISLLVPALRVFRIARAIRLLRVARAARGLRLVRVVTSVNRSMRALGRVMQRRGVGYVITLTLLVTIAGSAAMYTFERNPAPGGRGLNSYGEALWWTAMIMTTMGSEYWPQSAEGRTLCVILALYAFAVFGYVTATLASFFIGQDAQNKDAEVAGEESVRALEAEIRALRVEVRALNRERNHNSGEQA